MNEFRKSAFNKQEEKYRKEIQAQIQYCSYDQPFEEGEVEWIFGEKTHINDLFFSFRVPEEYKKKILPNLRCPSCGNARFDLTTAIGVKSKFEKDVDSHMDDVSSLYGKEVKVLEDLLEGFPLLAFQNDFAKRIYREIKNKKLPLTSASGSFFRARNVESSDVISSENMYSAPKGKPAEGRFNHSGQSHLYLANNKITAIKEVAAEKRALLVWYQEFHISKKIPDILDLSFDWNHLTPSTSALLLSLKIHKTIERSDRNKGNWKPDYYLTRYIMDCAKSVGYNGIKYNSSKNTNSYNVVLFNSDTANILPVGHPKVEVFLDKKEESEFSKNLIDH